MMPTAQGIPRRHRIPDSRFPPNIKPEVGMQLAMNNAPEQQMPVVIEVNLILSYWMPITSWPVRTSYSI